jgi:very-short-patch-repair endonuclease
MMSEVNLAARLIADLRTRLLDLTNSNKLLSYRHSGRAKTHVRVVDVQPDFLHDCLTNGKQLTFASLPDPENGLPDEHTDEFLTALNEARRNDETWLALQDEEEDITSGRVQKLDRQLRDQVREQLGLPPAHGGKLVSIADWARMNGVEPSFDLPTPSPDEKESPAANEIQTLLLPDELQGKMAGVMDHARTAQQEMGVNLLHVAIGFLEWWETATAEKPLLAPLLLYPAELERKARTGAGQYRYFLRSDQDPVINITLRQRLANDYNLIVPELEDDDTPETYMARMAEAIRDAPRWRVRRFATVGLFSFSRVAMYNDLDPARWGGEESLPATGVLHELFSNKEAGSLSAETYNIEDPAIEAEAPLLIRDADSSQHQAIIDVMRGKNLVIKGPPGTGKSQTIANIIAATLAKGKSVLFVAEKAAALDVVKKRLDEAGLGDFCFELHSTKAKKIEVLNNLERRMNLAPSTQTFVIDSALSELRSLRQRLSRHAETINLPFGALEICDRGKWRRATIHDILWAEQRTRSVSPRFPALDRVCLSNAAETSRFDAERRRSALVAIERLAREFITAYGAANLHPWGFVTNLNIQVLDVSEIVDAAREAAEGLRNLEVGASQVQAAFSGQALPSTLAELSFACRRLARPPSLHAHTDDRLLKLMVNSSELEQQLRDIVGTIEEWRRLRNVCTELLAEPRKGNSIPSEAVNAAVAHARRLNFGDLTLADIGAKAKQAHRNFQDCKRLVDFARTALDRFDIKDAPVSPRVLKRILEAIDLLSAVERRALLARIPTALEEEAHQVLVAARDQLVGLRAQDALIRKQFVIDANLTAVEIRRHARILRSTGFFGKLSGDFKLARQTCAALLRSAKVPEAGVFADLLAGLADQLEACQSFERDARLRSVCAHRFFGLDTDVDALLAANRFAAQVRSAFSGFGEPERSIRRLLLEADVDTLDGAKSLMSDPLLSQLRKIVASMTDQDARLDEMACAIEKAAAQADGVCRSLAGLGFRMEVTPNQIAQTPAATHAMQKLEAALADGPGAQILDAAWKGPATDIRAIQATLESANALRSGDLAGPFLAFLVASAEPAAVLIERARNAATELGQAAADTHQAVQAFAKRVMIENTEEGEAARCFDGEPIDLLAKRLEQAVSSRDHLLTWVQFRRAVAEARRDQLAPLLDAYDKAAEPYLDLATAYDRMLRRSLARQALERYPELGETSGLSLNDIRDRFRDLDRRIMEMRLQELIAKLAATTIPPGVQSLRKGECTEAALIGNEIAKKKKHIPIRDLVDRASNAIRAMKPCAMMSPASVAQYLKPGQPFDLVLIDEASQMRPEEAIGALARARQAVIVGDPQQLPPPSFFNRRDADDHPDDEEFEKVFAQSILDVARTAFQPTRELLWHYRSRHGSLIAFSNHHFYNNRLIVFPSPQEEHPGHGVRLVEVNGQYRSSVNVPEVKAITAAAVDFMAEHPDKSLGIVALNQPQRDLILAEMDRLFMRDPLAERYRVRWQNTLEPFFVKNLENVQGNEADVIFISTVYGADENGNLMQRFGPINGAAGDRRLNVLFSRAKHGVTVFSSMRPDQLRNDASTSRGAHLLKEYLEFAATGSLGAIIDPVRECDSDFEKFVKERLEAKGYEVIPQIGVAGFWIDLGVKHRDWPYGFLLGVECDGAAYHSALSARDRDRLRQQVLESLGWTIYRVWSTDWFRDQNREVAKMAAFIERTLADRLSQRRELEAGMSVVKVESEAACEDDDGDTSAIAATNGAQAEEDDDSSNDSDDASVEATETIVQPLSDTIDSMCATYKEASFEDFPLDSERFFENDYKQILKQLIRVCVAAEGPIRDDVLARRISAAHGFQRTGNRIRGHVSAIARRICRSTREDVGAFFWPSDVDPDAWNVFRVSRGGDPRPLDEIAIQELRALALLAERDPRCQTDDAIVAMARIAGVQRLRASSRERLAEARRAARSASEPAENQLINQSLNGRASP